MTRWTAVALALVTLALAAVIVGVSRLIRRDRAALVNRFAEESLGELDEAVREIEEDLDDVGEDLRFAGQLVSAADNPADRQRELTALLAVVKQYRQASVFDQNGANLISVLDPLETRRVRPEAFDRVMAHAAAEALDRRREIVVSPRLTPDSRGWYRVFATALPPATSSEHRGAAGAISVLVDTEPFFSRLRLVSSPPSRRLLLLGAHGASMPASDAALASRVAAIDRAGAGSSRFSRLMRRMRAGARGTFLLPEPEARGLGLGRAEAIASYCPIRMAAGGQWSVATVGSTLGLRSHERAIVMRLGLASGAIAVFLLTVGATLVIASRRSVAMRERLRHAEELAHLHEKTEKILDNIPTGVMCVAEDGRVVALNRALRDRVPTLAIGTQIERAFPDAPSTVGDQVHSLVRSARQEGRTLSHFGERLALFGDPGQYNLHAVPLEPRFAEASALVVIEDLSEVRSLQSQLLRAEKLSTVGVLAAGIAHEIGTPLGVVRGRAEYVQSKLGQGHPQSDGIRVIIEQIDAVTRTIRQLLDFSRVRPAAVRPVAIGPVARSVAELLHFEASRRNVTITVGEASGREAVSADPDQLQQVLVNLVMNALDACASGGRVTISALGGQDGTVRLVVADTGCGIGQESLNQVFDPFFTTKKRGQGTGLGLTIAAQIVRNHGGQIELESEPGQGTRVSLLWPAARAAREGRDDIHA
ncbi:MAG: PAS domain-containing protein [Deltaproteobacteria bacterium]|nr:PAS domain-containing protein [Deltaproteobacteria bacterium]